MRQGTRPIWEDPALARGGYWSFKVLNQNILRVFEHLAIHLIIEQVSDTHPDQIVGVSTSPKKGFHIVKIWNTNSEYSDPTGLALSKLDIPSTALIYTAFGKKS